MPKSQKLSKRKANRTSKPRCRLVLENRDPEILNYPPNTWAILKPVDNLRLNLPYIFLTEPFNCLGKFPDSSPNHLQLPVDPQISEKHCLIRIENVTGITGVSSSKIILEDISVVGTMVDGTLIKRDVNNECPSTAVIRQYSRIAFPGSKVEDGLYTYELDVVNLRSNGKFERVYKLGKKLGKGHFSSVYMAKRINFDGNIYAVKILEKPTMMKEIQKQIKMIKSEIQILNSLAHDNLIKIFDYYEEPDKIYLVIEYVEDGEFFEFFKDRILTEKEIRIVFLQLFNAIKYLHDRKIVHRDLKPENILMPSKEGLRIKVSDFGLSKLLNIDYSTMQTVCGTVSYVAPEVLESNKERSYNRAVDMWSAGVILYACLCGDLPFHGNRTNEVIEKIKAGTYLMNSQRWNNVSESAKDLVCGLLTKDSYKRLTVEDALNHSFIKCERNIPPSLNYGMYESIHTSLNYGIRKFKQSDETSTSELFYSCVSQFPETSTNDEELCKRSFVTASETIRSYSNIESEISSPSEGSF